MLTDTPSFQGAPEYLTQARAATRLPVLRKDFMLEPYQVREARALGRRLHPDHHGDGGRRRQRRMLIAAARAGSMDALVEVHDEAELERALALEADLIGINNRDLKTFVTDLGVTHAARAADSRGLSRRGRKRARRAGRSAQLAEAGVTTFLIGESLMRAGRCGGGARARCWTGAASAHDQAHPSRRTRRGARWWMSSRQGRDRARARSAEAIIVLSERGLRACHVRGQRPKGDVLAAARIAGIMAAKKTPS